MTMTRRYGCDTCWSCTYYSPLIGECIRFPAYVKRGTGDWCGEFSKLAESRGDIPTSQPVAKFISSPSYSSASNTGKKK